MKITCSGPNGEKFEASGCNWQGGDSFANMLRMNEMERQGMQEALETWCKSFGINPKEAKVTE